jgi:hypothetical protein
MIVPLARLRAGIDMRLGVTVLTKLGAELCIMPVLVMPNDILAGKLPAWHVDAIQLRDAWAQADLFKVEPTFPPELIGRVCLGAVLASYDIAEDDLPQWFADDDGESVLRVCSAACGRSNGNRPLALMRKRALDAALVGLGDARLTPIELAFVSDWAVNSNTAPRGG